MQSWPSSRLSLVAACASLSAVAWGPVLAAEISGSIRFGDEHFELDVRSTGASLPLRARGCNNFDLSFASSVPGATLDFRDAKGAPVGTAGTSKIVEVRTCRADRYLTELVFGAPTTTTWRPQADESRGAKKVRYTANLAPIEIRFEPTVELTIFDRNKRIRPLRVSGVARASVHRGAQLTFSSDALHFQTTGATIRRRSGFTGSDLFSLSADGRLVTPPEEGRGSEITFDANPKQPASLSLYYPLRGPHVLAFFKDESQGTPTSLGSLRVDGEQRLIPELTLLRTDTLTLDRGPFDFLLGKDRFATGSLVLAIGKAGMAVRNVRVESQHPQLSFRASGSADSAREVSYARIAGGIPLEVPLRVQVPNAWKAGERSVTVLVSSEGGLRRQIPVTINIIDRHSTTRIALLALLAAIVIALGARAVLKRHEAQSQQAAARTRFIQQHYDAYDRFRERAEGLLASDAVEWPEVEPLLREFVAAKLHTGLLPAQWHAIDAAAKSRNARATLEALERALTRFDA